MPRVERILPIGSDNGIESIAEAEWDDRTTLLLWRYTGHSKDLSNSVSPAGVSHPYDELLRQPLPPLLFIFSNSPVLSTFLFILNLLPSWLTRLCKFLSFLLLPPPLPTFGILGTTGPAVYNFWPNAGTPARCKVQDASSMSRRILQSEV